MTVFSGLAEADGLNARERADVARLARIHANVAAKQELRRTYYLGHQPLKNLGIAVPKVMDGLDISCCWAQKAVDVLAARSLFEGFGFVEQPGSSILDEIVSDNDLVHKYGSAVQDELRGGCTFAVLSRDDELATSDRFGVRIMFHDAATACAVWDARRDRIRCGMAVVDVRPADNGIEERPCQVNYYNDTHVVEIERDDCDKWRVAARLPHAMGRPMMEPLVYKQSDCRPFGISRINGHVRALVDEYMRIQLRKAVSSEVNTTMQKYALGVTEDDFDMEGFDAAVGHLLLFGRDEDGNVPQVGQFSPASMEPHIASERSLAGQFSAATSIPASSLGVDYANPTNADSIYASKEDLVIEAQNLNKGNLRPLRNIAMMALAIAQGKTLSELTAAERSVYASFGNAAAPSINSQADAAIKINTAAPWYSSTENFWEELGYDKPKRDRLMSAKARLEARERIERQSEQATQSGGIDDTSNFYRITSIVKDFSRGAMSRAVADRMLSSLGLPAADVASLLSGQDGGGQIEIPASVAGDGE